MKTIQLKCMETAWEQQSSPMLRVSQCNITSCFRFHCVRPYAIFIKISKTAVGVLWGSGRFGRRAFFDPKSFLINLKKLPGKIFLSFSESPEVFGQSLVSQNRTLQKIVFEVWKFVPVSES